MLDTEARLDWPEAEMVAVCRKPERVWFVPEAFVKDKLGKRP